MKKFLKLRIHTDGAARGNPGPAGAGIVIHNEAGQELRKLYKYLGEMTNNQAEYTALIYALKIAEQMGASEVDFFLDSELVVRQLRREYKVKNLKLKPLFEEVLGLMASLGQVTLNYVPREANAEADRLANWAIDHAGEF